MATVRLTRRGRVVLVMTVMFALVIAGLTLGHGSSLAASHAPAAHQRVTVEAGETLWAVAARVAPHDDPRIVIADIESFNHLQTANVEPGQQLVIPTFG
jgi:hypothetical protein